MNDLRTILDALDAARQRGQEAVLATVVEVRGSAYRRPGARMFLTHDGRRTGTISGGCLEAEVCKKAWWLTEPGRPVVMTYDSLSDEEGPESYAGGCKGVVRVLLERVRPRPASNAGIAPSLDYLDVLRESVAGVRRGILATVYGTEGDTDLGVGEHVVIDPDGRTASFSPATRMREDATLAFRHAADLLEGRRTRATTLDLSSGRASVLLEQLAAPLRLVIFGAGPDAIPLANFARNLGWRVAVVDRRPEILMRERFPHAAEIISGQPQATAAQVVLDDLTVAVVMTHQFPDDAAYLRVLLASSAPYVGVLGPRHRTRELLREAFGDQPPTPAQLARLHAPIGLDIGGETPEEIALAIVGEVQAIANGRAGGMLRNRQGSIHDRADQPGLADRRANVPVSIPGPVVSSCKLELR